MRITTSLLNHFFAEKLPLDNLEEVLTNLGLEVEAVEKALLPFDPVLAAVVRKTEKHPKADRLNLVTLFDGTKELTVVCGDQSVKEKDLVPLVQEGACYIDDLGEKRTFRPKEIRGVFSAGMLLSEEEIGLGEGKNGVLKIHEHMEPGENLSSLLQDEIYDIALTPNLGHCQSALGIARQISASLQIPYQLPTFQPPKEDLPKDPVILSISTKEAPIYTAKGIEGIQIIPSPLALRFLLQRCGQRSINYIVDVTNLMMLLYGQPMHAFDMDHIEGKAIEVKRGNLEEFSTLDLQKHTREDILLIYDAKKPIAIAGVMGGLNSAVTEKTKNILLEAAYFDPATIRSSSKKLSLKTESSIRFEKGIDPEITMHAMQHACHIISSLCKGKVTPTVSIQTELKHATIPFSPEKASKVLGISLTGSEMESMLQRVECETKRTNADHIQVRPPLYRHDLELPIDLVEEIAKLYGFNTFEKRNPTFRVNPFRTSPLRELKKKTRDLLCKLGLNEIITCDLISENLAKQSQDPLQKEVIHTVYSKSKEHSVLRSSFFGSHLEVVKGNLAHGNTALSLFEISYLHTKKEEKVSEHLAAGITLTGNSSTEHFSSEATEWDFYQLKGVVEQFLTPFQLSFDLTPSSHSYFHPYKQQSISFKEKTLGIFGEVHPDYLVKFDIKQKIYFAQIDLYPLLEWQKKPHLMKPLPQFPGSQRDWTIPLSKEVSCASILNKIHSMDSSILQEVKVLSRYEDPSQKDLIHLTFRFTYRDPYKTLSHDEVEKEHARIIDSVNQIL